MSKIDIEKYFKYYRNENGFTYCIEQIGDIKELIKDIRRQNNEIEKIKEYLKTYIQLEPDTIKTDILEIIEGKDNE